MASYYNVVIVGGGPAGIAAALAVRRVKPGWSCAVFERAKEMKEVGASVALLPNGLKSMHAISPDGLLALKARGATTTSMRNFDLLGETVLSEVPRGEIYKEWQDKYGHAPIQISWYDMQQALLQQLPPDVIHLGHSFESYEETEEGVSIRFSAHPEPVRAGILIGADGANSAVRRAALGQDSCCPEPTGNVLYRAVLPVPDALTREYAEGCIAVFGGPHSARMLMFVPLPGRRVALHASAPAPSPQSTRNSGSEATSSDQAPVNLPTPSAGVPPAAAQAAEAAGLAAEAGSESKGASKAWYSASSGKAQRFEEQFAGVPEWVLQAVAQCPEPYLSESAELRRPATGPVWGVGRVTLVGDAAHLIPPVHAQGTSQAFEDALQLAHSLAALGPCSEALRSYEGARMPRIGALQEYERSNPRQRMTGAMLDEVFGQTFEPLEVVG